MSVTVHQFSCPCGARDEGMGVPPPCWSCRGPMRQWGTREADYTPRVVVADRADSRTANGGY
jgi:hypothetical protein